MALRPEDEEGAVLEPQTADVALPADQGRLALAGEWTEGEDYLEAAVRGRHRRGALARRRGLRGAVGHRRARAARDGRDRYRGVAGTPPARLPVHACAASAFRRKA